MITPYGRFVESVAIPCASGELTIPVQNPMAALYLASSDEPAFATIVKEASCKHAMPWTVIVYTDGISPADPLNKHDRRKLVAIYWTLQNFGPEWLCREECWFTLATVRTSILAKIDGGLSHLCRLLLQRFMFNANGIVDLRRGIDLSLASMDGVGPSTNLRLIVNLVRLLNDEVALMEVILCMGHAGYKICPCCANVINHRYIDKVTTPWAITSATTDVSLLRMHTDESARATLRKLLEIRAQHSTTELAEKEKLYGFHANEHNLLLDNDIPVGVHSSIMWDWLHVYLENGLLDNEFGVCMRELNDVPVAPPRRRLGYEVLAEYVIKWAWPGYVRSNPKKLFDPKSNKKMKAGHFSSTASELLTLVPVLTVFFVKAQNTDALREPPFRRHSKPYFSPLLQTQNHLECQDAVVFLTWCQTSWSPRLVRPKGHHKKPP